MNHYVGKIIFREKRIITLPDEYYTDQYGIYFNVDSEIEFHDKTYNYKRDGYAKIITGNNVTFYPPCIIYNGVEIGDNSIICANTVIRQNSKIGHNSVIGTSSVIEGDCKIGNHTTIETQCHISNKTEIGDWVFIGPMFTSTNTPRIKHGRDFPLETYGSVIGFGVRIGGGVVMAPKLNIGSNALIGLGALVIKDIPNQTIVFGSPATPKGIVPKDELLYKDIQINKCELCRKEFNESDNISNQN